MLTVHVKNVAMDSAHHSVDAYMYMWGLKDLSSKEFPQWMIKQY